MLVSLIPQQSTHIILASVLLQKCQVMLDHAPLALYIQEFFRTTWFHLDDCGVKLAWRMRRAETWAKEEVQHICFFQCICKPLVNSLSKLEQVAYFIQTTSNRTIPGWNWRVRWVETWAREGVQHICSLLLFLSWACFAHAQCNIRNAY